MTVHLSMEQLIAVRDGDRSEPEFALAHRHAAQCAVCARELQALHQRTAQLRALPTLMPARDQYPALREQLEADRWHRRRRFGAVAGLAAAAAVVLTVIGRDLVRPTRLDAEQQLATAISSSQRLENELHAWRPEGRVVDSRTAVIIIQLEDRIARLDGQLADAASLQRAVRLQRQVDLWKQRVGLMNALVEVHLSKAKNVGL